MLLATQIGILHQGKIQQTGTPQELFDRPNHRCVAEMLGQPGMQFFDIAIASSDFHNLEEALANEAHLVPEGLLRTLERAIEVDTTNCSELTRLCIGVRPTAWKVETAMSELEHASQPNGLSLRAIFVGHRFLGHQSLLQFTVHGATMKKVDLLEARSYELFRMVAGTSYRLIASACDLHFFDESGTRLRAR